jgi:hypothetical protein
MLKSNATDEAAHDASAVFFLDVREIPEQFV